MNKILDFFRNIRMPKLPALGNFRLPANLVGGLRRLSVRRIVLFGVTLVIAVVLFVVIQNFTACWRLTELPGIPPASCSGAAVNPLGTPVLNAKGTPLAGAPPTPEVAAPEVTYPEWDGGSRINIAFFGLRGNTGQEDCPLCTDTIMVFTVDPISKTAGMISVPRDLYVAIPGCGGCTGTNAGFSRINTAWTFGEGLKMPGGGPGEAMRAVSQFLGVPIQYYVQVDFDTFISMINLIKGIDIYNDENLLLQKLGGGKDGIRITCCGMRHLYGQAALAYARCRDAEQGCTDGDAGRAKRQQKVIMAIRDKVLNPDNFPTLMANAPQMYQTLSSGIHTNLSLQDGLKLANLMRQIPLENIKQGVIGNDLTSFQNVTLGGVPASVIVPIPDKIRVLRDEIFTSSGPTSPMAQGDPRALMQADAARIEVTNASYTAGLEQRTGNYLVAQGMQVTAVGPQAQASDQTVVIVYSAKLYALRFLISPLGMISTSRQIIFKPDPNSPVDLEVRLGNDWVAKLPAGF